MRGTIPLLILAAAASACDLAERPQRADAAPLHAQADPSPPLQGTEAGGGEFSLDELSGDPVVVIFYRGAFCGLCRKRLLELDAHHDAYERIGGRVVAVTLDDSDTVEEAADELELDLRIISADRATFEAWGVWLEDERWPRPAAFVLDRDGRVRYGHIGLNASDRVSDVILLGILASVEDGAMPARAGL